MEIAMTLILVVAAGIALVLVPVLDILAEHRRTQAGPSPDDPSDARRPQHRTTHLTH